MVGGFIWCPFPHPALPQHSLKYQTLKWIPNDILLHPITSSPFNPTQTPTTTQKQIVLVLLLNVKSRLQDQRLGHGMRTLKGSLGKHNKAWCCAPLVIGHPLEWIRYYANGIWDTSTTRTRWTDITSTLDGSLVLYPNKMRHFPGTCSNFRDSKQEASDKCGRKRTIRWSVITSHRSPLLRGDTEDWGKDRGPPLPPVRRNHNQVNSAIAAN